jgi:hypothetical protein
MQRKRVDRWGFEQQYSSLNIYPFKHNVVNKNDYATKVVAKVVGSNLPPGRIFINLVNYGIKLGFFYQLSDRMSAIEHG